MLATSLETALSISPVAGRVYQTGSAMPVLPWRVSPAFSAGWKTLVVRFLICGVIAFSNRIEVRSRFLAYAAWSRTPVTIGGIKDGSAAPLGCWGAATVLATATGPLPLRGRNPLVGRLVVGRSPGDHGGQGGAYGQKVSRVCRFSVSSPLGANSSFFALT